MSANYKALKLPGRAVITVGGEEAETFLNGLLTNDVRKASGQKVIYAALLTPQGKYLFDFFIWRKENIFFLDCEKKRKDALVQKLTLYKLRASVDIADVSDEWDVWSFTEIEDGPENPGDGKEFQKGVLYRDPRVKEIGWRAFLPKGTDLKESLSYEDYDKHRLSRGLPDGSRDMGEDKLFILEANFKDLNGVDFKKGCYVGQELTARMTYRGSLKKRMFPARVKGPLPDPGAKVLTGGKKAGEVLSGQGDQCLVFLRLKFLDKGKLETEDGTEIEVYRPGWMTAAEKD